MEKISLLDYQYNLPQEKIALFPPKERGASKLLVYKEGNISHNSFKNISSFLDQNYFLFFNNTKVLPARLYFEKETGAIIEIFLLNPTLPTTVISQVMESKTDCSWECVIGKLKRWKEGASLEKEIKIENNTVSLKATLINKNKKLVKFEWNNDNISFAEIVENIGNVPLPPYLNRKPVANDKNDYQTVYSKNDGAVAAPTAGLHFTDKTLNQLKENNINSDELTLHVGAGTFQPIKEENVLNHEMHKEQIVLSKENLQNFLLDKKYVAVGTTSMRTMESTYWYGVKLLLEDSNSSFLINKLDPYKYPEKKLPNLNDAIKAIINYMELNTIEELVGETEIFIYPGYKFRVCNALITNFHQPSSTLILLVAAFIGKDWVNIYNAALENDYRFLSYGDSSVLFRND